MPKFDSTKAAEAFKSLCETIAALRHPETGCPWDLEQTHETLRKYMIEEAYEAVEVMHPVDHKKLCDELGDVLLQVVLNSQLATDSNFFTITEVVKGLDSKMRRRHPHVFGEDATGVKSDQADIKRRWEEIKSEEKEKTKTTQKKGIFSEIQPGKISPSIATGVAIGKLAKKINFDWSNPLEVLGQLKSEIQELEVEMRDPSPSAKKRVYSELGDVFFSLAQLSRHLDIDPEICGQDGNRKFLKRFATLESLALKQGIEPSEATQETLERLWQEAKKLEKAD